MAFDSYEAHLAKAAVLRKLGRLEASIAAAREAVRLRPGDPEAHVQLASSLHRSARVDEASLEFEAALRLDPGNARALTNYGNLNADAGRPARAIEMYRAALESDPANAELHSNLGNIYKLQGQIDLAIAAYEQTLSLKPDAWQAHSNLLVALNCDPRSDQGLLSNHVAWARRHASHASPAELPRFENEPSPDRRLRIGYVSQDFRRHSVAYFFEPLLAEHNREEVEVTCYSSVLRADEVTERTHTRADRWRNIVGLTDTQVVQGIRDDRIDVLVDLAGHMGAHRLLVFAARPAPVQVTYLSYPNTTGLETMDWRLTDADADPPGMTEGHYTERLARLPHGFLCYSPPPDAPSPRALAESTAPVTFGSFNNLAKASAVTIELWSRIVRAVPRSRLVLKAEGLADAQTCDRLRVAFAQHGVDPSRVTLLGHEPSRAAHLAMYHQIDIALDTFPFNGATTTCEALWMGVPVITLAGHAHVSRVGVSLLTRLSLSELIAQSPDGYVDLAVDLARDPGRRRDISSEALRERMRRSPLLDASRFARDVERTYRAMWRDWCGGRPGVDSI